MAAPTQRRLLGPDGATDVRSAATAADAATWTPEDATPNEDVEILDAREWEAVRVLPSFRDVGGAPIAGTSITVIPLVAVPDTRTGATKGRQWVELPSSLVNNGEQAEVAVDGHRVAFRLSAVVLGAATDVVVRVTGGVRRRNIQQ